MQQRHAEKENKEYYKELSQYVHNRAVKNTEKTRKESNENLTIEQKHFMELEKENHDLIGWLTIPGTSVDYPVVQRDNSFYLGHNFAKRLSKYGVPFLDESLDCETDNLVIYGHHMRDGTMFGALKQYESKEFYQNHSEVIWYTKSGLKKYQIICTIKADAEENADLFRAFLNGADIYTSKWQKKIQDLAYYDTKFQCTQSDRLIILVTCEYTTRNGRMVLIAKEC